MRYFINKPWGKFTLGITLSNVIKNAAIVGQSRAENKAGYVRDGPEKKSLKFIKSYTSLKSDFRLPHVAFFWWIIFVRNGPTKQHLLSVWAGVKPASLQYKIPGL